MWRQTGGGEGMASQSENIFGASASCCSRPAPPSAAFTFSLSRARPAVSSGALAAALCAVKRCFTRNIPPPRCFTIWFQASAAPRF